MDACDLTDTSADQSQPCATEHCRPIPRHQQQPVRQAEVLARIQHESSVDLLGRGWTSVPATGDVIHVRPKGLASDSARRVDDSDTQRHGATTMFPRRHTARDTADHRSADEAGDVPATTGLAWAGAMSTRFPNEDERQREDDPLVSGSRAAASDRK